MGNETHGAGRRSWGCLPASAAVSVLDRLFGHHLSHDGQLIRATLNAVRRQQPQGAPRITSFIGSRVRPHSPWPSFQRKLAPCRQQAREPIRAKTGEARDNQFAIDEMTVRR
jgi:hypothetical protein